MTDFLERRRLDPVALMPFFSMADRRKRMHCEIIERFPEKWPGMLSTVIHYRSEVEQMGVRRAPIAAYAASSYSALTYAALWNEIKGRLHE